MLDYQLSKDIQTAIETSLPKQVGDVLTKRLTQADADAKALDEERKMHKVTSMSLDDANKIVKKHRSIDERETALEKREQAVAAREQKAELNEYKVTAAGEKVQLVTDLVRSVFRNPTFVHQKSVFETVPAIPQPGQYGPQTMSVGKSETTTIDVQ